MQNLSQGTWNQEKKQETQINVEGQKVDVTELGYGFMDWYQVAQDMIS